MPEIIRPRTSCAPRRFAGAIARIAGLAALLAAAPAAAYTPMITDRGLPVRWRDEARLDLAGNRLNASGLSPADVFGAAVRGLRRWESASGGGVRFDYWQGADPVHFAAVSALDGYSSLHFASQASASEAEALSAGVLGLTQLWYDLDDGRLLEADIVLNDRAYRFTLDPRDTSGYGTSYAGMPGRRVFLENVLTHELGHAFGLAHAGTLQASMLFMESPEQARLGCDDQVGIRAMYGPRPSDRGALRGRVVEARDARGVLGAHVVAISRRRGVALATALTDRYGRYEIGGLEPGEYFLMVEPFYAGPRALPGYYAAMGSGDCDGRGFGRSALTEPDGFRLRAVRVSARGAVDAPPIAVSCGERDGALIAAIDSSARPEGAPTVFDGLSSSGGFGVADRFDGGEDVRHYVLRHPGGRLEVQALAYSLYSPVRTWLSLQDPEGREVAVDSAPVVYRGESGYVNFDSRLVAAALDAGEYRLRVRSAPLSSSLYPAGPTSLDPVPFVVLTGSVNESPPSLAREIPDNARCRMEERFARYESPPGPPRQGAGGEDGGFGFCAPARRDPGDGGGGVRPPTSGRAIAGWLLPWALMLGGGHALRRFPRPGAAVAQSTVGG